MRRVQGKRCAVVCLGCCLVVGSTAGAELEYEAEVGVVSAYAWRGLVINDEPCIQPSLALASGGMSASLWATHDLTDVPGSSRHTRIDGSVHYEAACGPHVLSSGLTAYVYPDVSDGRMDNTVEWSLGYALDMYLLPSFTAYYDFEKDGIYCALSVAHSREWADGRVAADVNLSLGAGDENYNSESLDDLVGARASTYDPEDPELVDLTVSLELPLKAGDLWEITPGVTYSSLVGSELRDAVKEAGRDASEVVFSLSAGAAF